jgi:hypothetical protein
MNKTEQAQQLHLAAELIETGHPFEVKLKGCWERMTYASPIVAIANGNEIRPILATPPDNRPLHNPDKLTAEQVGVGYRLALIDEKTNENEALQEFWNKGEWMTSGRVYSDTFGEAPNLRTTYRLPLSVPWPEAKPDPYAELKSAHAAGKAIEAQMPNGEWFDYNPANPQWNLQPECYRIKPEPPAFQLPPPPPGMRWHRENGWKEGDLPQGYRPLVEGEELSPGDEGDYGDGFMRFSGGNFVMYPQYIYRTSRPLIFTHEGKEWTWHRPGDPMPCDGGCVIRIIGIDGKAVAREGYQLSKRSARVNKWSETIGWRYAETTKQVELGPEDVPPCSAVKGRSDSVNEHAIVCGVGNHGIILSDGRVVNFNHMKSHGWKINRSIPLTGRWNPDAWDPCSKSVQIAH